MNTIDQIDKSLFLLLNQFHADWVDSAMWMISKMQFWFPVYALMLFLIYRKYKTRGFLLAVVCVSCLLFITDFLAVKFVKETVLRERPSYDAQLLGRVHLLIEENGNVYKGGRYGFFSNHASNHFGVAMFFWRLMRPMKTWSTCLLFVWVSVVAYSRIYLGVHYPGDILAGALYGLFFGWLISRLFSYLSKKYLQAV